MLSDIFSKCALQFDDNDDRHDDGNETSCGNGLFSKLFSKSSYYSGLQQSQASAPSTNICKPKNKTVELINVCHVAILEDWSKKGIIIDPKGQHELLNRLTSSFPRLVELEAR